MKIVVREAVAADLEAIFHWISKHNPRAAADMVRRIRNRINRLAVPGFARIGRPGQLEETRELIEHPYVIVYEVDDVADEISVLAIFHGAQNRSPDGA